MFLVSRLFASVLTVMTDVSYSSVVSSYLEKLPSSLKRSGTRIGGSSTLRFVDAPRSLSLLDVHELTFDLLLAHQTSLQFPSSIDASEDLKDFLRG